MKRALLIAGSIAIVLVAAAAAVVAFFPKDLLVAELKKQVLQSTGRTLDLGPTAMTFWPALGLSADNVQLSNPPGFAGAPFLKAKRIVFAVAVAPLMRGDFEVKQLFLDTPEIALVAPKTGAPNWAFPAPAPKPGEKPSKLKALRLDDTRITHGRLTFAGADGAPLEVSAIDAALTLPSLDAPATLKGAVTYRDQRVTLDAAIATPRALIEQGSTPLKLAIDAAPVKAALDGAVNAATGAVSGKLDTNGASVRRLIAWLGAPLPAGGGFGPFRVSAEIAAQGPTIAFAKGDYRLDALDAHGDISFVSTPAGRLTATGALAVPILDVNPYLPAPRQAAAGAPTAGVNTTAAWDAKPLDLAGLRAADADLTLAVGDLRFQKMQFANSALRLRLTNGVMDANLSRVAMYDGAGTAHLIVDASGATAKIRSDIDVDNVQALPLLTAAIGFDKIEGRGHLRASLTGQGRSQADIMRALGGSIGFSFNDGAWRGVNLAQIARTVQAALSGASTGAAAKTDFAEFAADFAVTGGVATTENLRLLNPFVRLDGKGALDIGAQTLDMHIAPRAVRAIEGQGGDATTKGIGVPFRVSGPWSRPSFAPDLAGLAQTQLSRALGGRSPSEALGDLLSGKKKDGQPTANPLDGLFPRK